MTTTLSPTARHFARRFSGGITPALATEISGAHGGRAWFANQLSPSRVPDPFGARIDGWYPSLKRTPAQIFARQKDDIQGAWEVMADLSRWTVARRIHSTRQVNELMVDFWSNLLHVPLGSDEGQFWRVSYDHMIRQYALTSFEQLLLRATTHPAMGLNLDNAVSTKDAPNENLGRELLELHTVGLSYTEDDVKSSARILTGYRVDVWWPTFASYYDPEAHWTGRVKVLGFTSANASADGRAVTTEYLRYLAHHPLTAKRIARRLCVKFVHDNPSPGLVSAVADAYTRHHTAIQPTLLAMVDHPEYRASAGSKVRTPIEDYVATVRALGITLDRPTGDDSFGNAMYWQYRDAGQAPYEWPAPNGFPEVDAAWTSAGRILTSFGVHRTMAAHWWPTKQVRFPSQASYFPALPATLQSVIDHVGLKILGQTPGVDVSRGIATLLGKPLSHRVTRSEADQYWTVISIVSSLLDSPIHLHR
ncbi:MAG: DUF1800 domain-containing protein [Marmoricola sp.]